MLLLPVIVRIPELPGSLNSDGFNEDEFAGGGTHVIVVPVSEDFFIGFRPIAIDAEALAGFGCRADLIIPCANDTIKIPGEARTICAEPAECCGPGPELTQTPIPPPEPEPMLAYAYYYDWVSETPTYWVRHDGAPEGELFTDLTELLEMLNGGYIDERVPGLGLKVSADFNALTTSEAKAIGPFANALSNMLVMGVGYAGFTHVFEYDAALGVSQPIFYFNDASDDNALVFELYGNFFNETDSDSYDPPANAYYWDYNLLDEDLSPIANPLPPPADAYAWGIHRFAVSVRPIGAGDYQFAMARDGVKILDTVFTSTYLATWTPTDFGIWAYLNGLGWFTEDDGPGRQYTNNVYGRYMIGYDDGDADLVAERSVTSEPKKNMPFIYGGTNVGSGVTPVTTFNIPFPVEAAVGDRLVATVWARSAITMPAGWVLFGSHTWGAQEYDCRTYPAATVVNETITQTVYVYTKVADASDISIAGLTFSQATAEKMGGQVIAVHCDDRTPVIAQGSVVRNQSVFALDGFVQEQFGTDVALYTVKTPVFTGANEYQVAYSFVCGDFFAHKYVFSDPGSGPVETELDPEDSTYIDDYGIKAWFRNTTDTTQVGFWQSWRPLTPTVETANIKLWTAWKYLHRDQSTLWWDVLPVFNGTDQYVVQQCMAVGMVGVGAGPFGVTIERTSVGCLVFE